MRSIMIAFAVAALTVTAGVMAQQSTVTGVPSRLRLQSLFVNNEPVRGYSQGFFTGTVTDGCTTQPTLSVSWMRSGNVIILSGGGVSCTSNSTLFRISGAPTAIRSIIGNTTAAVVPCTNNGVFDFAGCYAYIDPQGRINLSWLGSSFTASGTKGIGDVASSWNAAIGAINN